MKVSSQPARYLVVASTAYLGHQLYDQRVAHALLRAGDGVIYVEPAVPLLRLRSWHRGAARRFMRTAANGTVVVTPWMLPMGRRNWLAVLTGFLVGVQLRIGLKRRGLQPTGVVMCAAHPATARLLRCWPTVAVIKDDYARGSSLTGQDANSVLRRRRALLTLVDDVAVVSPTLRATLLQEGVRAAIVPAGCDPIDARQSEPDLLRGVARPRAVFIGMLSDRIDFEVLQSVVDAGCTLVLVGRRQFRFSQQSRYDELIATGRVVDLGEHDSDTVARIMLHCDIGLVPYTLSDFNLASFPLKTFEYLAAGLPVVATALPSVLWLEDQNIFIGSGADETAAAIRAALTAGADPVSREACRATAARNTWAFRAESYREMLTSVRRQE